MSQRPNTTTRSVEYELGHTEKELKRLATQARLIDPITRRFFQDAGIVAGMRVLDEVRRHAFGAFPFRPPQAATGGSIAAGRSRPRQLKEKSFLQFEICDGPHGPRVAFALLSISAPMRRDREAVVEEDENGQPNLPSMSYTAPWIPRNGPSFSRSTLCHRPRALGERPRRKTGRRRPRPVKITAARIRTTVSLSRAALWRFPAAAETGSETPVSGGGKAIAPEGG